MYEFLHVCMIDCMYVLIIVCLSACRYVFTYVCIYCKCVFEYSSNGINTVRALLLLLVGKLRSHIFYVRVQRVSVFS